MCEKLGQDKATTIINSINLINIPEPENSQKSKIFPKKMRKSLTIINLIIIMKLLMIILYQKIQIRQYQKKIVMKKIQT